MQIDADGSTKHHAGKLELFYFAQEAQQTVLVWARITDEESQILDSKMALVGVVPYGAAKLTDSCLNFLCGTVQSAAVGLY